MSQAEETHTTRRSFLAGLALAPLSSGAAPALATPNFSTVADEMEALERRMDAMTERFRAGEVTGPAFEAAIDPLLDRQWELVYAIEAAPCTAETLRPKLRAARLFIGRMKPDEIEGCEVEMRLLAQVVRHFLA